MLVAERKANVLERVQQVEDEQVLKMIEAMLEVHLGQGDLVDASPEIPAFNPLNHHTPEAIAGFEAREDFIGYDADSTPLYGKEEAKKADRFIEGVLNGTAKVVTHEELKQKMEAKFEAWQQRTK